MTDRKIIPIQAMRLSHSTISLLNTCERKLQIEKLLHNDNEREHTAHTVFGSAFGIGVAEYFIYQDREQALYKLWLAYHPILELEGKKTVVKCINALECAFDFIDTMLEEYELVHFNGKPAAELSFCITINEDYYFVGYIDVVLKHRYTGKYVVLDVKTTGLELHDLSPLYKNSAQLIGYSIVLDAIVGEDQAEYDVMYLVEQMGREYAPVTKTLSYPKTVLDRLQWFISLGLDVERLTRMKELNIYPRRGDSCLRFNKPCFHFGVCDLHSLDMPKEDKEDLIEYDFYYDIDTLIETHVNRVYR